MKAPEFYIQQAERLKAGFEAVLPTLPRNYINYPNPNVEDQRNLDKAAELKFDVQLLFAELYDKVGETFFLRWEQIDGVRVHPGKNINKEIKATEECLALLIKFIKHIETNRLEKIQQSPMAT